MPLTGNQAESARRFQEDVELNDDPWALNQIIAWLNGTFGMPAKLTAYNSASNPVIRIQNNDPTYAWAISAFTEAGAVYFDLYKDGFLVKVGGATMLNMLPTLVQIAVSLSQAINIATANSGTVNIATGGSGDVKIGQTTGNVEIGNVNANNTDIFIGGTGSYVSVTAANVDFATSGYFHINGATPITTNSAVTGTYTGNGAVTQRQITTGFQVKSLILERVATGSQWFSQNTSNSLFVGTGPTIQQQSAVHLHASDGFWVADGSVSGNTNTETFNYTAFR